MQNVKSPLLIDAIWRGEWKQKSKNRKANKISQAELAEALAVTKSRRLSLT